MRAKPIFTYSLLAGALALPGHALALGLGKLTVESALGQPLSARIELTSVSREDLDSLRARIADPALYRQNNLTYQGTLTRARVALEGGAGTPYLRVTSPVSVQEPFLDLLVELDWASGRVVREYTVPARPPRAAARRRDRARRTSACRNAGAHGRCTGTTCTRSDVVGRRRRAVRDVVGLRRVGVGRPVRGPSRRHAAEDRDAVQARRRHA